MKWLYLLAASGFDVDTGRGQGQINIPTVSGENIFVGILNGAYLLAGIILVIMIIVAGFQYTTSNGDSAKTAKAKQTILYAIVGIVFIFSAFIVTQFVMTAVAGAG